MKYFILVIFLINLSCSVYGQLVFKANPVMKQNRVKTKTQYKCDESGGNCNILFIETYDKEGRLIKFSSYNGKNPSYTSYYSYNNFNKADTVYLQFSGQKKFVNQIYLFNKKGLLLEYLYCYSETGCKPAEKYVYNNLGKVVKRIKMNNDGIEEAEFNYTYDKLGNNSEITVRFKKTKYFRKTIQNFDSKHRIIKSVDYENNNERIDSTKYTYDKNGNLLMLNWMGGLGTKSISKYDKEGNEIEYRVLGFGNQINEHKIMTYKNKLVQTRIDYRGKSIKANYKFIYGFY